MRNEDEVETSHVPHVGQISSSPSDIADIFLKENKVVSMLEAKQMWYWDTVDKIWRDSGETWFMAWMSSFYPEADANLFNKVHFFVQSRSLILPEQFKPNPYYLNFRGESLDLKTLDRFKGISDSNHHLRIRLDTELDLKAGPPRIFLDALQKAIPDGRDLYHCLQAFASMLLIRTMRIEKAFFFLGSGGNGKSTIMKAVENVFPGYISHVDLGDLVKDQFAAGSLVDKLANVYADIQSLKFKDMAIFKAISSGDTISVNNKYEKRHDETIKVIQIYSANKMPYIDDKNYGFLRRASPVVFDIVIKNLDPLIDAKLKDPDERKKILALLIRVARITKEHDFLFEKSEEDKLRIIEEKEDPITQFVNDPDWLIIEPEREIEKQALYRLYKLYCKEVGCAPKQLNAFSRYLTNKGFGSRKTHGKTMQIGLSSDRIIVPKQDKL